MKRIIVIALAMVLSAGIISSIFAQPRKGKLVMEKLKSLNLSEEQEAKLNSLRGIHQKNIIDLQADMQKTMIDKRELIGKGTIDRKKFLELEEKILSIKNKIAMAIANHKMDVYASLTPEQQGKISKMPFFFDNGFAGKEHHHKSNIRPE